MFGVRVGERGVAVGVGGTDVRLGDAVGVGGNAVPPAAGGWLAALWQAARNTTSAEAAIRTGCVGIIDNRVIVFSLLNYFIRRKTCFRCVTELSKDRHSAGSTLRKIIDRIYRIKPDHGRSTMDDE
jgi:hypothetical protein